MLFPLNPQNIVVFSEKYYTVVVFSCQAHSVRFLPISCHAKGAGIAGPKVDFD